MQHVHRFGASGEVDHPVRAAVVRHANLLDTPADRRHWFEIVGLLTALHFVQLIARIVPRVLRKISKALEGVAEETHGPHNDKYIQLDIRNETPLKCVPCPRADLKTDGICGIRVNHLLEVQIDGFGMTK